MPQIERFRGKPYSDTFGVANMYIIKKFLEQILRCWQCRHNFIDTYLHAYILTYTQPYKNKLLFLLAQKIK